METELTLEAYLEQVGRCRHQAFGSRFRQQWKDHRGTAELAMLAAPSEEEFQQFTRVVAAMTETEKYDASALNEEQIAEIAQRADAGQAETAIFLNGYVLACKKHTGK